MIAESQSLPQIQVLWFTTLVSRGEFTAAFTGVDGGWRGESGERDGRAKAKPLYCTDLYG